MKSITVYDTIGKQYRTLNPFNYNDDLAIAAVLFDKEALEEIKRYFVICGYFIISKVDKSYYPIDIQPDKFVMLEGTYNCLPKELKKELVRYNTTSCYETVWSHFFSEWIYLGSWECFKQNGSFVEMCTHFIEDMNIVDRMITQNISVIEPNTYDELCEMVRNSIELSKADFYTPGYYESHKYLVDSLIHHYHINFSSSEITEYMYQICHIINKQWEEHHA